MPPDKFENEKNANRALWNEWTDIHEKSEFYNLDGFKSGKIRLNQIERDELGDVTGKSLLHLQCHFGLNTLSLARLGAIVTGVDFSEKSIALARKLADELKIDAQFVLSDIENLPDHLTGQFDIVFTSYGVLTWLPDLTRWAEVIAHFLKPGGIFYIAEFHPFAWIFDDAPSATEPTIVQPYFTDGEATEWKTEGSYADRSAEMKQTVSYEWIHPLSEIINALIGAGLRIDFLHEFPYTVYEQFPFVEKCPDGYWRLKDKPNSLPLVFSIQATKARAM